MNNEHRNPDQEVREALDRLSKGQSPFPKGMAWTKRAELIHDSEDLRNALRTFLKNSPQENLSILGVMPLSVIQILLQEEEPKSADEGNDNEDSQKDDEANEDDGESDEAAEPDEASENDSEDAEVSKDESSDDEDNFKKFVLTVKSLSYKKIASIVGLFLTVILLGFPPLSIISLIIGIIPLLSGVLGDVTWKNSFKPMKWIWFIVSLILSGQLSWLLMIIVLIDGIFILKDEKVYLDLEIPPQGTDQVSYTSNGITSWGFVLPWTRFTIGRFGNVLGLKNITELYGGDNAQNLQHLLDPEIKSNFWMVFFWGYKEIQLKDATKKDSYITIRVPVCIAKQLVDFLREACETAIGESKAVTHIHV